MKQLTIITRQLQQLKSEEGFNALILDLKSKTRQVKVKDQEIKTLVQDVNTLNLQIEKLLLENESLRYASSM